jgi:dipeptidyl aminopeptidase/acylaminoacyl peptidase
MTAESSEAEGIRELETSMRYRVFLALCLATLPWVPAAPRAQSAIRHPFRIDDWAALRPATPVAVSADGASALYHIDAGSASGPTQKEWRLIAPDGTRARTLALPEHFTPFGFTRQGALYGGYTVDKRQQLALVPVTDAASLTLSQIILLPSGIAGAVLSPDGARFAILASPKPPDDRDGVHTVVEADRTSLYVVNVDGTGGSWWCPALTDIAAGPLSGGALAWSADSSSIAVLSQTPKIGFHDTRSMIDVCSVSGARHVTDIPNAASGIAWMNGGADLAFLSTTNHVLTPDHVWTVPAAGGTPTDRTPALAGSALSLVGDPHGRVWVVLARGVHREVDLFDRGALAPAFRWPEGSLGGLPVFSGLAGAPDQLVFGVGDPMHSSDLAVPAGATLKKITTHGSEGLATVDLGPVRTVRWKSKEGIALEGIATFPAGYQADRRYPFLVLPHGGPESNDTLTLDAFPRIIAGLGYVVLQPEYRGSTGYGADFLEAIYQHFGDRAYRDVDSATDFAIAQGWADPNRLAIFGWSAGGFMTSWTVTQTSRYRAAIEGAGITDWASFMWTSDVQQWDYDGRWPDRDPQVFQQFSAVMHAEKVTTPLLVLHGEADARVPAYQGREFFEALAAHGKTTRMVTYPGSGHFPSAWEQRRDVFREIANWLTRHNPAGGS